MLLTLLLVHCGTRSPVDLAQPLAETLVTPDLKIIELSEGLFIHVSYNMVPGFGRVASNGLIYVNGNEAMVFDTPMDDKGSRELLAWIEQQPFRATKVVVNHHHADGLGGLDVFHEAGIQSFGHTSTVELARGIGLEPPESTFADSLTIPHGTEVVHVIYPGPAHTVDNIAAWIPEHKLLFGGCMVKSLSSNRGFVGDADTLRWAATVQHLKNRFSNAKIVIPGHGKHGDRSLLDYTIAMFGGQ